MHQVADLPSLHFAEVAHATEHELNISARESTRPRACPNCGHTVLSIHNTKPQRYFDAPVGGKRVLIWVDRRRYKCESKHCQATFTQPLTDMHDRRRMTARLGLWLETEYRYSTDLRLAHQTGLSPNTVRELRSAYYDKLWSTHKIEAPRILGLDELKIGGSFKTVFTNLSGTPNTVVDLLDSYSVATIVQHLNNMSGIDNVEIVCIDNKPIMRQICKRALPNATIVLDKFHVCKAANETFARMLSVLNTPSRKYAQDKARAASAQGRHDSTSESNKSLRSLLLRKHDTLNDKGRDEVHRYLAANPRIAAAHRTKETFHNIYDCKTRAEAIEAFKHWKNAIPTQQRNAWRPVLELIEEYRLEFFAYFDVPGGITNAFSEWVNGELRNLYKAARSMDIKLLRSRAIFECQQVMKRPPASKRSPFSTNTTGFALPPAEEEKINLGIRFDELFVR